MGTTKISAEKTSSEIVVKNNISLYEDFIGKRLALPSGEEYKEG